MTTSVHEREATSDLGDWFKGIEGISSEYIADGEKLVIDLDDTPALTPYIAARGARLWQRLRAVVVPPNPELPRYGLVEARLGDDETSLMLVSMAEGDKPAAVAKVLRSRAVAGGSTWESSIMATADSRFVIVEHAGNGATEVIGAQTTEFQGEHVLPMEIWAPPMREVMHKGFDL